MIAVSEGRAVSRGGSPRWRIVLARWLDDRRVRRHLARVERTLRARDDSHLPEGVRANRRLHLARLRAYWQRGIYPRNDYRPEYAPVFIDRDGRACAVAHLVIESGQGEAARRIAAAANHAYVREMHFPELDAWAQEAGLTRDELALIQPYYIPPELADDIRTFMNAHRYLLSVSAWLSLAGVVVSAFNGARLWKRRKGLVGPVVGLATAGALLVVVALLIRMFIAGQPLQAQLADLPFGGNDATLTLYFMEVNLCLVASLIVAVVTLAVSGARLIANRGAAPSDIRED